MNGGASCLQALTSETNYFSAELNLVEAQLNERLALVQLYQSLGGGWQQGCLVAMIGSAFRSITSAQCQRHFRRLAPQLIFYCFQFKIKSLDVHLISAS